jgi:flagellar motor component MotA
MDMSSEIGLIVIVGLYISIGVMAAAGAVYIAHLIQPVWNLS